MTAPIRPKVEATPSGWATPKWPADVVAMLRGVVARGPGVRLTEDERMAVAYAANYVEARGGR